MSAKSLWTPIIIRLYLSLVNQKNSYEVSIIIIIIRFWKGLKKVVDEALEKKARKFIKSMCN